GCLSHKRPAPSGDGPFVFCGWLGRSRGLWLLLRGSWRCRWGWAGAGARARAEPDAVSRAKARTTDRGGGAAGRLTDISGVARHGPHFGERVVDKLPLVVVVLLLVDQDGLAGDGGGEADDAGAAKGLSAEAGIGARAASGTGGRASTGSGAT